MSKFNPCKDLCVSNVYRQASSVLQRLNRGCVCISSSLFWSNVQSVKSTGAASIFLYIQQDTAYSLMITVRFQSEKWRVKQEIGLFYWLKLQVKRLSFLLRSMPIFKAIDSKTMVIFTGQNANYWMAQYYYGSWKMEMLAVLIWELYWLSDHH